MINSKKINQAILAFLIIIIFCFFLRLILYSYFKYKDKYKDNDEICFLKTFIIIQAILLFITWSMSLSLLSKLNKIRKNEEYMNLTDDIRKNIIIVIIIISLYFILFISDIICIYFDDIKDYFSSLKIKPFFLLSFLEIVFIIIILSLFPYEKYFKFKYFNEILEKEFLNNTYDISESYLEKSYKVARRINRTILSFSIIILVIFVVKFIRIIYENYCDGEESENCISIFNCIIIFFLFMNLFFGFILISKINKIKNNEINSIVLYKINEILIIKILKIMTLFSCYIILLIFEFIIFYVCIKKEKIEYITRYETIYVNSERNNSSQNRLRLQTSNYIKKTITPTIINVAPIPDFLKDIINNLYEKIEEFLKTFIEEENKVKEKKEKFLKRKRIKIRKLFKKYG